MPRTLSVSEAYCFQQLVHRAFQIYNNVTSLQFVGVNILQEESLLLI